MSLFCLCVAPLPLGVWGVPVCTSVSFPSPAELRPAALSWGRTGDIREGTDKECPPFQLLLLCVWDQLQSFAELTLISPGPLLPCQDLLSVSLPAPCCSPNHSNRSPEGMGRPRAPRGAAGCFVWCQLCVPTVTLLSLAQGQPLLFHPHAGLGELP